MDLGVIIKLGLYWDNGKENANYYSIIGYILGLYRSLHTPIKPQNPKNSVFNGPGTNGRTAVARAAG